MFFVNISIAIILFTLGIFIGLMIRNNHLINNEIKTRAEANIQQILKAREWNAQYGGVYVEKKEGVESNPYLENPDFESKDGRIFTLKNPALMTHEISVLSEKDRLLTFRMTSLDPINPDNSPDKFEEEALRSFEMGKNEVFSKEKDHGMTSFRYMVPLFTEESCLQCHSKQGYKLGDLRGGISVKFDISNIEKTMKLNNVIILILGIISAVTLLVIVYSFTIILKRKLEKAQQKIKELSMTDELTGLYNRRYFYGKLIDETKRAKRFQQNMGCILLDIDYFKKVNDKYGHLAGDMVLKNISDAVKSCCREIDTVSRYGGEEFIILLPGTDLRGSHSLAEKIRVTVENHNNVYEEKVLIPITVSLGATSFSSEDLKRIADIDDIIKHTDKALYTAKENGRNRVETA